MKNRAVFLILLICGAVGFVFGQDAKSKIQFDVLDENGKFFADLKSSDIQIAGLKDLSVSLVKEKSLEIMIMIDASASQEMMLPLEKKAAQTFIGDFLKADSDKVAIVSFTGKVGLMQDLTGDFAKAKTQIEKIEFVPPSGYIGGGISVAQASPNKNQVLAGSTSVWDSLKDVLEAFAKVNDTGAQRAILLISDGFNTYGKTRLEQAVEYSIKAKIPVYAIGIGDVNYEGVDKKTLKKLTEETGGISVVPGKKLEDLPALLETIAGSLRSGYELTFTQNSTVSNEKLQEIKIELVSPELRKRKLQIVQPRGFWTAN